METEDVFENIEHLDRSIYRHLTTQDILKKNQTKVSKRTQKVKGENGLYQLKKKQKKKKKNVITYTLALQYNM